MVRLVDSFPLAGEDSPWPDGLDRFDLETCFVFGKDHWGMQHGFAANPPLNWTWADVEQAWSVLGAEFMGSVVFGREPDDFWALREWGRPC